MSIFAHAHTVAIAAGTPKTKCAHCVHHEATIADLQAYIEDLRQSRDRWRDLALDVEHAAADVAADAARTEARNLRLLARLDRS
jgi:hypothetical protein